MPQQDTPFLIPMEAEAYWEKIRELLHAELQKAIKKDVTPVSYEVAGMVQKPLYKAHEVCTMLQISRQTLHSWVKEGILKQYKIKSRSFFLWSDLEKLITPLSAK